MGVYSQPRRTQLDIQHLNNGKRCPSSKKFRPCRKLKQIHDGGPALITKQQEIKEMLSRADVWPLEDKDQLLWELKTSEDSGSHF